MDLERFPWVNMIALVAGGLLLLFLKQKFPKIRRGEVVLIFVLYALLVVLFTEPVVILIKRWVE